MSAEQAAHDIKERIVQLCSLSDDDLRPAMTDLKAALMENPDAVALMLPQDIGEMVKALRRITGEALAIASAPKAKGKPKQKALTAEELNAALDEL